MPNQLNFGSPIVSMVSERPFRPSVQDQELMLTNEKTVIFGSHPSENIEIWFYKTDGTYAGSVRLGVNDSAITLSTILDNTTGPIESTNIDLVDVASRARLQPGRYSVSIYFFRDEVGSEIEKKMLIAEISPSRTEVKLAAKDMADDVVQTELYEFIVPSVPRLYAKGLIDEIFGKSINSTPETSITVGEVSSHMEPAMIRVFNSNAASQYAVMYDYILNETYKRAIEAIRLDVTNYNVQSAEILNYISTALDEVLAEIKVRNMADPRFNLV